MVDVKTTKELAQRLQKADDAEELKNAFDMEDEIQDGLTFAEYFNSLDKVKRMSRAELIHSALLDRTYGYQILDGRRKPSRDKIIALGSAAGLSELEMHRALMHGGYADLYARNKRDAVIMYCLAHHMNVMEINALLDSFHEEVLK